MPPILSQQNFTIDIFDDLPIGSEVFKLDAKSDHLPLKYSIMNSTASFFMDDLTGILKLSNSTTSDFYELEILVTDSSPSKKSSTAYVHINVIKSSPKYLYFEKDYYVFFLPETFSTLEPITRFKVQQFNEKARFYLMENLAYEYFRLNPETGLLMLKKELDYETKTEITFHVMVEAGNLKNFTQVKIMVQVFFEATL